MARAISRAMRRSYLMMTASCARRWIAAWWLALRVAICLSACCCWVCFRLGHVIRHRNQAACNVPNVAAFNVVEALFKVLVDQVNRHARPVQLFGLVQLLGLAFLQCFDVAQITTDAQVVPEL